MAGVPGTLARAVPAGLACALALGATAHAATPPDGRAYELVSPGHDNGGDVFRVPPAADDGEVAPFQATGSRDDAEANPLGSLMVSRRTAAGWTVQSVTARTQTGAQAASTPPRRSQKTPHPYPPAT